jgi:hypothetical protein
MRAGDISEREWILRTIVRDSEKSMFEDRADVVKTLV